MQEMAQLVLRSGRRGRGFKSRHPDRQRAWSGLREEFRPGPFSVRVQRFGRVTSEPGLMSHEVDVLVGRAAANEPDRRTSRNGPGLAQHRDHSANPIPAARLWPPSTGDPDPRSCRNERVARFPSSRGGLRRLIRQAVRNHGESAPELSFCNATRPASRMRYRLRRCGTSQTNKTPPKSPGRKGCSPRTWRWSAATEALPATPLVLSTHVEVVRPGRRSPELWRRALHARGGGPPSSAATAASPACSPRTWRWSGFGRALTASAEVLSTHVEVVRCT